MSDYYGIGDGQGGYYILNEELIEPALKRGSWIVVNKLPFRDGDTLNILGIVSAGEYELRLVKPKKKMPDEWDRCFDYKHPLLARWLKAAKRARKPK